jgi:putative hydrolase of the HAD superfamily
VTPLLPTTVRAVVLDLDDTLVDHSSAADAAVTAWAREHGVPEADAAERWARVTAPLYAAYQRRELTHDEQRRERVRDFLGVRATDAEADALFDGYLQRYEAGWRAFDDAGPALRRLRAAGLRLAVLTNGDQVQQHRKLTQVGLADHVDLVVASSSIPAAKPDPRAFRHVVDALAVRPDQAVMVGDSLDHDVRGALAAGLRAVLVDRRGAHVGTDVTRVTSLAQLG